MRPRARQPACIFVNGIGDQILNLPALRAIAELFHGRLALVCRPDAAEIFFSDLPLRAVHPLDARPVPEGGRLFDAEGLASAIGDCDLLVSLNPWHSPSADALLEALDPAESIGFFPAFGTMLPLDFEKHTSDLAFDVPRALGVRRPIDDFSAPPRLPANSVEFASQLRERAPGFRTLAVHAETKPERTWPPDRARTILDLFLERWPDVLALEIARVGLDLDGGRHGARVIPCAGLPLAHSVALVAQADLFVGVDSSMLHVADWFRVPGVGLFGPSSSAEFGFRFGPHRHVHGDGSMEGIDDAEVLDALNAMATLDEGRAGR